MSYPARLVARRPSAGLWEFARNRTLPRRLAKIEGQGRVTLQPGGPSFLVIDLTVAIIVFDTRSKARAARDDAPGDATRAADDVEGVAGGEP